MQRAGNTPIVEYPEGKALDFAWVGIKDESKNPTGTFKDRRSDRIMQVAHELQVRKLVLISAGNAAFSLADRAKGTGIDVIPVIDDNLHPSLTKVIREICPKTIVTDLDQKVLTPHDLIALARTSPDERILEVSNGFHDAYGGIVEELDDPPDVIVVPCGSGEAMVGIHDALQRRGWPTKVLGVGSFFVDKLRAHFTPYYVRLAELSMHGHRRMFFPWGEELKIVESLSCPVEAEPAAKLVFGALKQLRGEAQRILLVNSGKGKILERIPDYHAWPTVTSPAPLPAHIAAALEGLLESEHPAPGYDPGVRTGC